MKLRLRVYRWFQNRIVEKAFLPQILSASRIQEGRDHSLLFASFPAVRSGVRRAWFHAASVGELESLAPLILEWAGKGEESIITVLSESARNALIKLAEQLQILPGKLLFFGYSPWEGAWEAALKKAGPTVFLTAKYEAWPELWVALAELGIPLLIVSAKARRSLKIAGFLCRALGGQIPRLTLLTVRPEDTLELREVFRDPAVRITKTGEPRWDRVQARALEGSARAHALLEHCRGLPRPWGVLGSVWAEDMELWRGRFAKGAATLWVVPHRVDPGSIEQIERYLLQAGLSVARTSQLLNSPEQLLDSSAPLCPAPLERMNCVLVDEMGFLLELYAAADWAYVGGGFGVSMHSTIEPALFGIAVACGPKGAEKFPEIGELIQTGQLTLVETSEGLDRWLLQKGDGMQQKRWKAQSKERLGATKRIFEIMGA